MELKKMFATSRLKRSVVVVVAIVGALLSTYCGCDLRTQLAGGSSSSFISQGFLLIFSRSSPYSTHTVARSDKFNTLIFVVGRERERESHFLVK